MTSDEDGGTRSLVPVLYDCGTDVSRPLEDASPHGRWVPATAILDRPTAPGTWAAYRRVAATLETIRTDTTHGATYLSIRALEVLRDRAGRLARDPAAARSAAWEALAESADALRAVRTTMVAIERRIDRVMYAAASERTALRVERVANGLLGSLEAVGDRIAARAHRHLGPDVDRLGTLSRSGTAMRTIDRLDPSTVLVAESRPGGEGVAVANRLHDRGVDVAVTTDAAYPGLLADHDLDVVLVGADAILATGEVVNKVGTYPAALAASAGAVPMYALAAAAKVTPRSDVVGEEGSETTFPNRASGVEAVNPVFERTPERLLDGVLTERGTLDAAGIARIARRAETMAGWP